MSEVLSDAEVLAILEDIGNAGESLLANPDHELGKVAASHRTLRQQRDSLREALVEAQTWLITLDGCSRLEALGAAQQECYRNCVIAIRVALAQCDTQEGV